MLQKDIIINRIKIFATIFNDIEEVIKYLNEAKTSHIFANIDLSSHRKKYSDFNETETFEEAKEYLEYRLLQAFSSI